MNFFKKFLNKKEHQKEIVADFHTTIIRVDDNFVSTSSVILDQRLIGNIYSLKEVTLTPGAEISGNITSRVCKISGKVIGDIISTEFAVIKSDAIICGNIRAKSINIESGSIINGMIRIEGDIEELDLIEKIENRLPPITQKEIDPKAHLIFEPVEAEQELVSTTLKQSDKPFEPNISTKVAAPKKKVVVSAEPEDANKPNTNS